MALSGTDQHFYLLDRFHTLRLCVSGCVLFQVKANPNKKPILSLPSRKLNKEQAAVLSAVLSGKNVFFTGSAGERATVNSVPFF